MNECAMVLLLAFLLDIAIGDPVYPLHPARLIGKLISAVEKFLHGIRLSRTLGGIVLVITVTGLVLASFIGMQYLAEVINPWLTTALHIFVVYSCLAIRDMINHAKPIITALNENNLDEARKSVQKIVGRNVSSLDRHGIARAAIESVSESLLDGFIAPLFWYTTAGFLSTIFSGYPDPLWATAAIITYKAINTLDSMVGYKNEKYMAFGKPSAKVDDVVNFIPARLSLVFMFLAALICRFKPLRALKIAFRDRLKHTSPNSAHTESFTAGALDLTLGGPTEYPHGTFEKPWIGNGTSNASSKHIGDACKLCMFSAWISAITAVIALQFIFGA